jgi:tetratricopeptide (TPR) repeat protein
MLLAPALALGTDLGPRALDALLQLDPADLPHAVAASQVMEGPILAVAAAPDGLLVVELDGVRLLDSRGGARWHVPFPEGIQRHAIPRSGRWVAGHSTRVGPDLERVAADWLIRTSQGKRHDLARDTHPLVSRRTGRRLLAWDPLPFTTDSDDEMGDAVDDVIADGADVSLAASPSLAYRRSHLPRNFLLEESLLILRTTEFRASGRSWWSLYHFDPDTLEGTKLGDGTPGPLAEELGAVRPHPEGADQLVLTRDGAPAVIDLVQGTLEDLPAMPAAPPGEGSAELTIAEVYHLTPGGPGRGVVLVHPGGRRSVALNGRTIRQLVRVPGSTAVFALEESSKISLLARERRRVLHRLDLGQAEANLAAHRATRRFQEKINRALSLRSDLEDPSLWKAKRVYQEMDILLGGVPPSSELGLQASRVRNLARVRLARRMAKDGQVSGYRELLRPVDSPEIASTLLSLDRVHADWALDEDAEAVADDPELWRGQREVQVELARAFSQLNKMDVSIEWFERLPRLGSPNAPGARAAIAAGDVTRRRGKNELATRFYQVSVRLLPTSAGARAKLGRALRDLGRSCAAARNLGEATHLDEDAEPGGIRATLFHALRECGDDRAARQVLDGLRVDQPLHPAYLEWDADLLLAAGQTEEARPKLKALLRLDPNNKRLREKLSGLGTAAPPREP